MAEGLNRVMLLGNLGADPELRTTQTGTAVLKLRLATTERYLDNNKAWQERTEWHRVVIWGKRGEALHRILAKGSTIFVEGSLRTSSYEKEGQKHYSTEVVANNVILAGGRGGGARPSGGDDFDAPPPQRSGMRPGSGGGGRPGGRPQDDAPADDFGGGGGGPSGGFGDDDDIPF
jgi:single-strand DNA-binding protein